MITLLLLICWPVFFIIKGVQVKVRAGMIATSLITLLFGALCLWLSSFYETVWLKYALMGYFGISSFEYILTAFVRVKLPVMPMFSGLAIYSKEATVRYQIFKPLFLIPVDLFLLIKRKPLLWLHDSVGVDIKAKDGTAVNIKI